jgi:hypothetical protein
MKTLIAFLAIISSLSAFAQSRGGEIDGRIILNNGSSTVRISINERNDVHQRLRLLEEAVRDLQDQVFDLRDRPRREARSMVVCSLKTTFEGTFIGKAPTKLEAEAEVRNKCEDARAAFCSSAKVVCESVVENY